MPSEFDDDVKRHRAKLDAEIKVRFPAPPRRPRQSRFSLVSLGRSDVLGGDVTVADDKRIAHSHTIGTTNSGKTNYLAYLIKQDIDRGRGVMLLDPHGGDPHAPRAADSLFATIAEHCSRCGLMEAGKVHIIDPARSSHAVGFNPLIGRPGFEPDVIADAMLQCVERVWKEDTHGKPATRTVLRATFIALSELRLTLNDAKSLLSEHDVDGLRRHAIATVRNEYARDTLSHLQDLAERRNKQDFDARVEGPRNRLDEFAANAAIKRIIGQTDRLLDLVEVMDQGHVLLVNLQWTTKADKAPMRLLGTMLLRYLLSLAPQRANTIPFFVTIDECQNFLSGDVPDLLREVRKHGIAMHLAHQDMQSLDDAGDDIHGAIINNTSIKTMFRPTDAVEARDLSDRFLPHIDYEMPVRILIKPTAVGQEIIWLESESTATQTSETSGTTEGEATTTSRAVGQAETSAHSHAVTEMTSDAFSDASMVSEMDATSFVDTISQSIIPDPSLFAPGFPITIGTPTANTLGLSRTRSDAASHALSSGRMSGRAHGTAHGEMHGDTYAQSFSVVDGEAFTHSLSHSLSQTIGETDTKGRSQALSTVYRDLPTAVHSRDTVLDMAARSMLSLGPGEAVVTVPGHATRIQVPLIRKPSVTTAELTAIVAKAFSTSRFTTTADAILKSQQSRHAAMHAAIRRSEAEAPPEPDDWADRYTDPSASKGLFDVLQTPPTKPPRPGKPRLVVDNDDPDDTPNNT